MQFLAIGKMVKADDQYVQKNLREEVIATVQLYLNEKIRQFYFRKDQPGIILLMEAENDEELKVSLEILPFVKDGFLEFELIPIGPLEPLKVLFGN